VIDLLARIPDAVIGALLAFAALDLIVSRRMFDARPECQPVIAAAAVGTLTTGAFFGLIIGLTAETLRRHVARKRASRAAAQSHRN
jgi:MFS superfamily sulfate permease-like transporter